MQTGDRNRGEAGDLANRMVQELRNVGGEGYILHGKEEINDAVQKILKEKGLNSVVRWNVPLFDELHIDHSLNAMGVTTTPIDASLCNDGVERNEMRKAIIEADVGLTSFDYAIADSGTLCLVSRPNQSPLVSLLPTVHIAIGKKDWIVESLHDVLDRLKRESQVPWRHVNFVTGPSSTADIELTATRGVHGPREVYLLLFDELSS